MCEYEKYETAQEMWLALKDKFGGTSITKLRRLTIKFDFYRKHPNHTMRQHMREMSNMVHELKSAGHVLTDEQEVQAMIKSLPNTWEHMKVNETHNENIRTFKDIERHLELKVERLEAAKLFDSVFMAESSSRKGSGFKRKMGHKYNQKGKRYYPNKKKANAKKRPRGKRAGKKSGKSKVRCYYCSKSNHFAREGTEQQKVKPNYTLLNYALVTSFVLLTKSRPV